MSTRSSFLTRRARIGSAAEDAAALHPDKAATAARKRWRVSTLVGRPPRVVMGCRLMVPPQNRRSQVMRDYLR